ncbi:MAG: LysM peptidoglycan-binding domain-containing protein [Flavobacteriales bacterium]|nr:LysM peptidoglycan-binding domain-containing protein [Flavobacteriales bacterium]
MNRTAEAKCIAYYFNDDCQAFSNLRLLSDLYFPLFERHLQSAGLEDDFKFLPIVASALNSSFDDGKNHAGLWGLSYPDARLAGLEINANVDQRKAPDLATKAAIELLKRYHKRYDGDPLKVVTAYLRGIHFTDRFTPGEHPEDPLLTEQLTLLHVSIRLFKHTEAEHHLMDWLTLLQEYEAVPLMKETSKDGMADLLSVDRHLIDGLNPAFHGNKVPGTYRVLPFLLPKGALDEFQTVEDSLYCYKPKEEVIEAAREAEAQREPRGDATYYTVRSGDVLGVIAQRFGVRVSELKRWNNLRSDRINVGQKLLVYGDNKKQPTTNSQPKKTGTKPKVTPKGDYALYTVQSGESLWLIAKKFPGVSADNIMEWNNITDDIRPGQTLKIYTNQ